MRVIDVELSPISIDIAVEHLNDIADRLEKFSNELANNLAERGKSTALMNINSRNGELASSINVVNVADGHCQLEANSPHAAFHEFGTGVVGQGTYGYPFPVPWTYNNGWFKNTRFDPKDPDKWFYYDPKDGGWHSTKGQQGHAFMAQAAESMRQNIIPLAKAGIYL